MTTDITGLAQREKFEAWVITQICISKSTLEGLRTYDGYRNSTLSGRDYNLMWNLWKAAGAELVEALEYYKSREERVTSLVRDNSKSWDELYRQIEAKGKRNAELVEALEKAQQRIVELESRTVTVRLPDPPGPMSIGARTVYFGVVADVVSAFQYGLNAAGIKVEAE